MEMKPSMVSSSGRSSAARSRYRCFCPGFGQISKMTAIILNTSLSTPSRSAVRHGEADRRAPKILSRRGGDGTPHFNRSGGPGPGPQARALPTQEKALHLAKAEVVGALMRHPKAEKISAALGNDGEPLPGVVFEGVALKRIELVADEERDAHGSLLGSPAHILPRCVESMLRILPNYASMLRLSRRWRTARSRLGRRGRPGDGEVIAGRIEGAQAVAVGRIA